MAALFRKPGLLWRSFCSSPKSNLGSHLNFDLIKKSGSVANEDFVGKTVLCVNTASLCGFTPQLGQLQELHERFADRGLRIIAIPSNDFGEQEPHPEDQIHNFYTSEYKVSFLITSKQKVLGEDAHSFYKALEKEYGESILPDWNFAKFLLDSTGNLSGVFSPSTPPTSDPIIQILEEELPPTSS